MMKTKFIALLVLGIAISFGSMAFVFAEDIDHYRHFSKCVDMGKPPKFDKFGNGYMASCIDMNPFGN